MASIRKIQRELEPWTPNNGGYCRYYVNNWPDVIGLRVTKDNRGVVSGVSYKGFPKRTEWYVRDIQPANVWFDQDAWVHVDHCNDPMFVQKIMHDVDRAFSEPSIEPVSTEDTEGYGGALVAMQERVMDYLRSMAETDSEAANIVKELEARVDPISIFDDLFYPN